MKLWLGFGVQSLGIMNFNKGFNKLGFRVYEFRVQVLGFRV